jgi:hypothetical protein
MIAYNLRDGGTAVSIFADTQPYRIQKARAFIDTIVPHFAPPAEIIELGCSAGDIAGWYSATHNAWGIDVSPAAVAQTRLRYPRMEVVEGVAETLEPRPCDILILCEFLEHIADPITLVKQWLPLAKCALIGHPLNDSGGIEPGHMWSYTQDDYMQWLKLGGHVPIETHLFSGPFPEMIMGISQRAA